MIKTMSVISALLVFAACDVVHYSPNHCPKTELNTWEPDFTRSYPPAVIESVYSCEYANAQDPANLAEAVIGTSYQYRDFARKRLQFQYERWRMIQDGLLTPQAAQQQWLVFAESERQREAILDSEEDARDKEYKEQQRFYARERARKEKSDHEHHNSSSGPAVPDFSGLPSFPVAPAPVSQPNPPRPEPEPKATPATDSFAPANTP